MSSVFRYPLKEMIAGTLCRVDGFIGTGGMATVYQVTEMSCERTYAFKHLNADLRNKTELRRMFVEEGKLLGRLHGHPNIVEAITQGVTADEWELPFIVMELLNGPNIRKILAAQKRLEPTVACLIMADVLAALEHAHEREIVHRDIKPENVVSHRDAEGKAKIKVVDFGIHRHRERGSRHRIAGTPMYMAPELFDEKSAARAPPHLADVYAAGVMLYELLTGEPPFDEPDDEAMAEAHRTRAPEPPSKRIPNLPVQLEDATMRALEKDPAKRWADAFEFMFALRGCLPGHVRGGPLDVDVHTRITAEGIPTHAGTPVDQQEERSEDQTDPGPPPEGAPEQEPRSPLFVNDTAPMVPVEILQMQIAKVTAGERGTKPDGPEARKALEALAPDGMCTTDAAPSKEPAAALVVHGNAQEKPDERRRSHIATQTRPRSTGASNGAAGRGRSGTPVVSLPPVRDDPAAPERLRHAAAQAKEAAPIERRRARDGTERADEPDRIWLDEQAAREMLAKIPDSPQPTLLDDWRDMRGRFAAAKLGQPLTLSARQQRLAKVMRVAIPVAAFLLTIAIGVGLLGFVWSGTRHQQGNTPQGGTAPGIAPSASATERVYKGEPPPSAADSTTLGAASALADQSSAPTPPLAPTIPIQRAERPAPAARPPAVRAQPASPKLYDLLERDAKPAPKPTPSASGLGRPRPQDFKVDYAP
jgi:serine/threonine protein kinase